MREPHAEGGSDFTVTPSDGLAVRKDCSQAFTGARAGQLLSHEINEDRGADTVVDVEGNTAGGAIASRERTPRGLRTWHARNLYAGEPGGLCRRSAAKVGTRCLNWARRDLCGGSPDWSPSGKGGPYRDRAIPTLLSGFSSTARSTCRLEMRSTTPWGGATSSVWPACWTGGSALATARTQTPIRALVASPAQFRAFKGNDTVAARLRLTAERPVLADGRAA